MRDRIETLVTCAKSAKMREHRAKVTCRSYVDMLRNKNLVNAELEQKLAVYNGQYMCLIYCDNMNFIIYFVHKLGVIEKCKCNLLM